MLSLQQGAADRTPAHLIHGHHRRGVFSSAGDDHHGKNVKLMRRWSQLPVDETPPSGSGATQVSFPIRAGPGRLQPVGSCDGARVAVRLLGGRVIAFTGHLDVALPPDVVFAKLADMAELYRWNPNVTASGRTGGDRLTPGSTYVSTIRRGPLRMTARSTLTAVEPGEMVTYEGSIWGLWSVDSLTFEPQGGGTSITFRNRSKPPGWLRPLAPILNAAFQPQARRAVEGARRYLERLAPDALS